MKAPYGTTAVSFAVFMALAGLSGCAGSGSGEPVGTTDSSRPSTSPSPSPSPSPSISSSPSSSPATGDTPGQQMFRDESQKRHGIENPTQPPQGSLPGSASPTPCPGYPGFDRGCPESAK